MARHDFLRESGTPLYKQAPALQGQKGEQATVFQKWVIDRKIQLRSFRPDSDSLQISVLSGVAQYHIILVHTVGLK